MKNAAAKGKRIGRPETTADTLPSRFWKYYKSYKDGNLTVSEYSRLLGCSRTTVYKYLAIADK